MTYVYLCTKHEVHVPMHYTWSTCSCVPKQDPYLPLYLIHDPHVHMYKDMAYLYMCTRHDLHVYPSKKLLFEIDTE